MASGAAAGASPWKKQVNHVTVKVHGVEWSGNVNYRDAQADSAAVRRFLISFLHLSGQPSTCR